MNWLQKHRAGAIVPSAKRNSIGESVRKARQETEGHVDPLEQIFEAMGKLRVARRATPLWASSRKARKSWRTTPVTRLWTQVLPLRPRRSSTTKSRAMGRCELGPTNWA